MSTAHTYYTTLSPFVVSRSKYNKDRWRVLLRHAAVSLIAVCHPWNWNIWRFYAFRQDRACTSNVNSLNVRTWDRRIHLTRFAANNTDLNPQDHSNLEQIAILWVNPLKPILLPHGYWASECPDVKKYKWWLNPVWHRMLYNCTHMATVGFKGLSNRMQPAMCQEWSVIDEWRARLWVASETRETF